MIFAIFLKDFKEFRKYTSLNYRREATSIKTLDESRAPIPIRKSVEGIESGTSLRGLNIGNKVHVAVLYECE